jgi:hypothetical protein
MSNNSITTHDDAASAMTQAIKTIGFAHEGAAGSTSLNFGVAAATHQDAQSSSTAVNTSDVGAGSSNGAVDAGTMDSGSSGGSGQNSFVTHDDASSYTQSLMKVLSFTHEGAAGSTSLTFGSAQQTHYEAQSSDTSAMFGDGLLSGWGSGSGGSSTDTSTEGSGGNAFSTSDHAVSFDSELMKAIGFTHEGAAGSTSLGFQSGSATHWDSQSSSTSAMFDDLFGQGLWSGGDMHSDTAHSLIG